MAVQKTLHADNMPYPKMFADNEKKKNSRRTQLTVNGLALDQVEVVHSSEDA